MKQFLILLLFLLPTMAKPETKIKLEAGGKMMVATLEDNEATAKLITLLPLSIEMSPYGGFEFVGPIGSSLPTSNKNITTQPGDIMLYSGNQMVIFYGNNNWSYTPLGHIDNATAENVKEFLGSTNITLTVSLESAGLPSIRKEDIRSSDIYDLNGRKVSLNNVSAGLYIIAGKKTLVK